MIGIPIRGWPRVGGGDRRHMELEMSYRLISKAVLTVVSAAGVTLSREVAIRAYPAPKRDAVGSIEIDGIATPFRRTGGKGRGTHDTRYLYATYKSESAYIDLTEAEGTALIGGTAKLVTQVPAEQPKAPEAPAPEAEQPKAPEAPKLTKAQRRAARVAQPA